MKWGVGATALVAAGVGLVGASASLGGPPALFAALPRFLSGAPAPDATDDDDRPRDAAVLVVHTSVAAKCPGVAAALAEPEARGPDGRPFRPVVRAVATCLERGAIPRVRVSASDEAWPALEAALDHLGVDGRRVTRAPAPEGAPVHLALEGAAPTDATFARLAVTRGEVVSLVTDDDL